MRIIYDQSGLKPPGAIQPILPAGTIHRPVMVMRLVSDCISIVAGGSLSIVKTIF